MARTGIRITYDDPFSSSSTTNSYYNSATSNALSLLYDSTNTTTTSNTLSLAELIRIKEERRAEQRRRDLLKIRNMRRNMDVLTDPNVMILGRFTICHEYDVHGKYCNDRDVNPTHLVTIGFATNVETRRIELWMSSPERPFCWRKPVDTPSEMSGLIKHITDPMSDKLMEDWIDVLGGER